MTIYRRENRRFPNNAQVRNNHRSEVPGGAIPEIDKSTSWRTALQTKETKGRIEAIVRILNDIPAEVLRTLTLAEAVKSLGRNLTSFAGPNEIRINYPDSTIFTIISLDELKALPYEYQVLSKTAQPDTLRSGGSKREAKLVKGNTFKK